jgi:hypothetical protein
MPSRSVNGLLILYLFALFSKSWREIRQGTLWLTGIPFSVKLFPQLGEEQRPTKKGRSDKLRYVDSFSMQKNAYSGFLTGWIVSHVT